VLCCPKTCLRGWRECQTCANPGTPGSHFLEGSTECRATTVVLSISAVYPVKMNALHDKRTTETCNVSSRTHVFTAYRWRKGKHCPFSCGSYVSRKGILIYYIIPQQRRPRMSCTCKNSICRARRRSGQVIGVHSVLKRADDGVAHGAVRRRRSVRQDQVLRSASAGDVAHTPCPGERRAPNGEARQAVFSGLAQRKRAAGREKK